MIVELQYFKAKINGSSKVIIVTDRKVKHSDLPQTNKQIIHFPKKFNNEDENFQRILGFLFGYEPCVLGPVEINRHLVDHGAIDIKSGI